LYSLTQISFVLLSSENVREIWKTLACSRRSDSGVWAKNKASERAGKNEGRLGKRVRDSGARGKNKGSFARFIFARAPLSERLEQARTTYQKKARRLKLSPTANHIYFSTCGLYRVTIFFISICFVLGCKARKSNSLQNIHPPTPYNTSRAQFNEVTPAENGRIYIILHSVNSARLVDARL